MALGIIARLTSLRLSGRTQQLEPSPTLAIAAKARRMRQQGREVLNLSVGEPDFNTPIAICDAAVAALRAGVTKYTPSAGLSELREAISAKLRRENRLEYQPSEVLATCGAKHAIYNSLQVLIDPGDEVLVFTPCWPTYDVQIRLAGGTPAQVPCLESDGYAPNIDEVRARITTRTRAMLINSPCNPTGAVIDQATMNELAMIAKQHDLWIISDEIYERLIYDGQHTSPLYADVEVRDQTVYVSGCSKTYAMTGWRLGYLAAPEPVIKAIGELQDQVTSNPTSFVQLGAIEALENGFNEANEMRDRFRDRRNLIVELLRQQIDSSFRSPQGAFYVYLNVSSYLCGDYTSDLDLASSLLDETGVATVPGSAFFGAGYLRLTYAASEDAIIRGVDLMSQFLDKVRP